MSPSQNYCEDFSDADSGGDDFDYDGTVDALIEQHYQLLYAAIAEGDVDYFSMHFQYNYVPRPYNDGFFLDLLERAATAGHVDLIKHLQEIVVNTLMLHSIQDIPETSRKKCIQNAAAGSHLDACLVLIGDDARWDIDFSTTRTYIAQNYYQLAYDTAKAAGNNDFCQRLLMAARPGRIFGDKQRPATLRGLLRREIGLSWRFA